MNEKSKHTCFGWVYQWSRDSTTDNPNRPCSGLWYLSGTIFVDADTEASRNDPQKPAENINYIQWFNLVGGLEHFSSIVGMMIQSDFHIFQRGWSHQPVIIKTHQGTIESHQSDVGYRSFFIRLSKWGPFSARLETEEPAAPAEARTGKI